MHSSDHKHSADYKTDRGFLDIQKMELLGETGARDIVNFLSANPNAAVLEIGCGEGKALGELKEMFPNAKFYGLDPKKPNNPKSYAFIQAKAEGLDTVFPGIKFDIIYSAATFPYIEDPGKALSNIAKALKPTGFALIGMEPFYWGPQAGEIFGKSKIFTWIKNSDVSVTCIRVKGNGEEKETAEPFPGFTAYRIPKLLLAGLHEFNDKRKNGVQALPNFYGNETKKHLLNGAGLKFEPVFKDVRCWNFFEFLQVNTRNPGGPLEAGQPGYRPFLLAATQVYLKAENLTEGQLIECLTNPNNYHSSLKNKAWRPSKNFYAINMALNESQECSKLPSQTNDSVSSCLRYGFFCIAAVAIPLVVRALSASYSFRK